jgi:prepilin-type processing-associated H-X9-DG protein
VDSDDKYPGNTLGAPNEANGDAGLFMPLGFLDPAMAGGLNWGRELLPYVKTLEVFTCPTAVKASQLSPPLAPGRDESTVPGAGNTAYLFNGAVSLKSATSIPLPAQTITFQEAGTLRRLSTVRPRMVPGTPNTYTEVNRSLRHDSHRVGANIAFCDGHAAYRRKSALRYADFGFPVALNPAPLPTHLSDDAVQAEVEKLLVFQADF